jgi:pyruvate formate lyase activating enzyme
MMISTGGINMRYTLFSATGCVRCKIVMGRMNELGIAYEEYDFKAEGKEAFQQFYTANRKAIYRGPEGIEFPILTGGQAIRQGVGPALAWLESGDGLDGFFRVGVMRKEWLDGINVAGGDARQGEKFLTILRHLKKNAMKLVIETNGKNADLLETVLTAGLADKVIVNVLGPQSIYQTLAGEPIEPQEVERSIAAAARFADCRFQTVVVPVRRSQSEVNYLTPAEVGETAKMIEAASGSKKQPYLIRLFRPGTSPDDAWKQLEPMTANMLFPYRAASRRYQVMTEIEKDNPA